MKETKELLKFAIELAKGIAYSVEDKKFTWTDLSHFIGVVTSAPAAFIGIKGVHEEIKNMTPELRADLDQYIQDELKIPQEKVEVVVEKGIQMALDIYEMVLLFKR